MPETSYGSEEFLRACRVDAACRGIVGNGPRATWGRLRAGSPSLTRYHRRLALTDLQLTDSPAGRMIAEHFSILEAGRFRYRSAQAVLDLPTDFADYIRGRRRQAVRTNTGHARRAGQFVVSCAVDGWAPGLDDSRRDAITPGPVERWMVLAADGQIVADSIVSVDRDVALLQGLVSTTENARWLLHSALVERLCGECSLLLTNSDNVYRLAAGTQHFQRLLGYRISRLRISRAPASPADLPPQPAGLAWPPGAHSCGIGQQPAIPSSMAATP
jgi:hypothetical protein